MIDKKNNRLKLLPNYYKKIGIGLILLTALIFIFLIIIRPTATQNTKELVKILLQSFFLIGLLIIAIARDRVENESIYFLRLKSMSMAFVFGVVYVIVNPLISILFGYIEVMAARELIIDMVLFYLILFYIQKRKP